MNGIIQAKLVGGFGNQLHQYVSARVYAASIGAELEVPDWAGKVIFGLTEPGWSRELPEVNDGGCGCPPALAWGQTNIRLGGYFQFQRWVGLLRRSDLRSWLAIEPEWVERCRDVIPRGPYTAAHVRQGDYIGHPLYANVSEASYARACAEHGLTIDEWVRQDSPRRVAGLDARLHFLPDFLVLMHAATLLRANSTFSWWAAALGDGVVYAPVVEAKVGAVDADFVKGNWPRCADTSRTGPHVEDLHLPP